MTEVESPQYSLNRRKRRVSSTGMLMDECSPVATVESGFKDRAKRVRMDGSQPGGDAGGALNHIGNNLGENGIPRENSSGNILGEFTHTTSMMSVEKRARRNNNNIHTKEGRFGHDQAAMSTTTTTTTTTLSSGSGSGSSEQQQLVQLSAPACDDHIFSAENAQKLRQSLYQHTERQMAASSDKMKSMEAELHGQKVLNQHLLSKLHEKDEESRVLRKGITISDGRNRDLQMQLQDLNAEHQRARAELAHAQGENGQLQHVLYNARNYILQLEQQVRSLQQQQQQAGAEGQQQNTNNGWGGGGGGGYEGDGGDGFMPPPPPDVF